MGCQDVMFENYVERKKRVKEEENVKIIFLVLFSFPCPVKPTSAPSLTKSVKITNIHMFKNLSPHKFKNLSVHMFKNLSVIFP